jgi:hypothetical protein
MFVFEFLVCMNPNAECGVLKRQIGLSHIQGEVFL